ncbi:oligosaccharide flippase family protein [Pleurocapsa sp. PCC 7319]|uniref:oligosaccharide flippase family protein n=1 Tax=Pleurocapsa sp. PCC 7319 TaxID=118161 RepID=UPI00036C9E85|nr:oligosaccharide flippase family protein [Pleurocapsa sp. PCC 7319]
MIFKYLQSRSSELFKKSLVKNTIWMLFSNLVSLSISAAYFITVARALGAERYGAFVGAIALIAIVAPFSSCGSGDLIVKNVSRNKTLFNQYWGNALLITNVSGLLLIILVVLAAKVILPATISLPIVFLFALSDLLFAKIVSISSQAFMAVGLLNRTAQLNILLRLNRLIAALCLVNFFSIPKLNIWASLYLGSSVISALVSFLLVQQTLGSPKLKSWKIKSEITEGFFYSVSLCSQNIYNDVDKTMLARLATLEATGIYGAAYRLIDVAFAPTRSLVYASYRKFFQAGVSGISGSLNLAKKLVPIAAILGVSAGLGVYFLAPIVPLILGSEYANSVEVLIWLAPLPFLKSMHYFGADTLTGAGFQKVRSLIQVLIAMFNVVANFWLIPIFSWKGAIWATLAADTLLMCNLWIIVWFLNKRKSS